MKTKASNDQEIKLKDVFDDLRDNFLLATEEVSNDTLVKLLGYFDRAVSRTILTLLDIPSPPHVTRHRRTKAELAAARGLASPRKDDSLMPERNAPIARAPRSRKRKSGLPTPAEVSALGRVEDASKQASIDDVMGVGAAV